MIINEDKAAQLARAIARQGDDLADSILCHLYTAICEADNDEDLYAAVGNLMDDAASFHNRTEHRIERGEAFRNYQHEGE